MNRSATDLGRDAMCDSMSMITQKDYTLNCINIIALRYTIETLATTSNNDDGFMIAF